MKTVLGTDNVSGLDVAWSAAIGGGGSAPAIVDGVLYVGSQTDGIYALDSITAPRCGP